MARPHNLCHAHQCLVGIMCTKFCLDDLKTVGKVWDTTFHQLTVQPSAVSSIPPSLISFAGGIIRTYMYIFILNCQISFLLQMSNYDRVTMSHYKTLQMYRTNVCAEKLRNLPSHKSCRKLWTGQKFDKIDKTEWNTLSQLHEAQNCVNYTVELKTTYLELRELHSWT